MTGAPPIDGTFHFSASGVSKAKKMNPTIGVRHVAWLTAALASIACGASSGCSPEAGMPGSRSDGGPGTGLVSSDGGSQAAGGQDGAAAADSGTSNHAASGQAAATTADTNAACTAIHPFYWEIGDKDGAFVGQTASDAGETSPAADTQMLIASASKWFFGAFVVELRKGNLSSDDLAALTMRSGYTALRYSSCIKLLRANQDAETVHQCFTATNATGANSDYDPTVAGKFFYNGAHFQWLADTELGLGETNNASLYTAITAQLGADLPFTYDSPQLAAGIKTSANDYARFLRKILAGELLIHDVLGSNAVCTNPATCPDAAYAPIPATESWHYSLGHWVEDDPVVGDGAFSSPGAFGFYPWIDSTKTTYGILARYASVSLSGQDPVAVASVECGRLIRKAWFSGVAQ